jgi:hypothetical protein
MAQSGTLLIGSAFGIVLVTSALAAPQQTVRPPSCGEFKERLADAEKRAGIVIPPTRYEDYRQDDAGRSRWIIPNYAGFDASLRCKGDRFEQLEITQNSSPDVSLAALARARNMIAAPIWVWTGWPKAKVSRQVDQLMTKVSTDRRNAQIRGETRSGSGNDLGRAQIDFPGGAQLEVRSGPPGTAIRVVLRAKDSDFENR